MNIYYDFDFFSEKKRSDLQIGTRLVTKKEQEIIFSAIYAVVDWTKRCIYQKLYKGIELHLTDYPGNDVLAKVDEEPYLEKVFIEINILNLIHTYYESHFKYIVFNKDISLFDFTAFFFLHELGHIVHAQLVIKKGKTIFKKMEDYNEKYLGYQRSLEQKYGYFYDDRKKEIYAQKDYRRIPSEKFSDSFAFSYLPYIK
jgi:hypothetical protein